MPQKNKSMMPYAMRKHYNLF